MSTPANYVLGQSIQEQERLMLQARILRPYTERFFRAAGIVPSMRVLDLGSGVGDVALLAADLVGPGGCVLGLDRDAKGLERARQRTVEQGCSSWVSFEATNLDEFSTSEEFDAIVGRYVLMYQKDAAVTLRHMMRFLKPGGIVVFHEVDFALTQWSYPPCEIYDQVVELIPEVFRRAGLPPDFGLRLGPTYVAASLPFPAMVAERIVGGGRGSLSCSWVASTLISLAPRLPDMGLSLPPGVVPDHTLAERLEAEVVARGSQVSGSTQFGAWARKPL
jgi:SAM-dependent methyltransferase